MKYLLTLSFFIFQISFAVAQNGYFITFSNPYNERCTFISEDSNKNLVGVGYSCSDMTQLQTFRGVVWKISEEGDTCSKYFSFSDTSCSFNYVEEKDNVYHIIAELNLPPHYTKTKLVHLQLDSNLNLLSKTDIIDDDSYLVIDNKVRLLGNEYYLLCKKETDSCDYDCIVKLDKDFNLLNFYILWARSAKLMDCILSPDSTEFWLFTDSYNYYAGPELIRFDSNFSLIEVKSFPFKYFPGTTDWEVNYSSNLTAQRFSNSKFLIGCNHEQSFNNQEIIEESIGYSLLDSSMNLAPIQYLNSLDTVDYAAFFTNFHFVDTNQIYVCGIKNDIAWFYPEEPSWIIAGKLDHNLEPVYTRYYGGDAYYSAYSIVTLREGGCIISLQRYDHNTQYNENDVSFLKLNSDGLITSSPSIEINHKSLIAYPNPATHSLTIQTASNNGNLNIYSLEGRLLKTLSFNQQNFQVDVDDLTSGMYLCEVIDSKGYKSFAKFFKN